MSDNESKIALFDMDDTLFGYTSTLRQSLLRLASPAEIEDNSYLDENLPHIHERVRLIKTEPGWWKKLPPYAPGWEIFSLVVKLGFSIQILTKGPRSKPHAWQEKVQCIHEHLGLDVPVNIVGKSKENVFGHVLVDDFDEYVVGWLGNRKRGLAIMPAHPHNDHVNNPATTHPFPVNNPDIIRYDGSNLAAIEAALQAVLRRQPHEHWRDCLTPAA